MSFFNKLLINSIKRAIENRDNPAKKSSSSSKGAKVSDYSGTPDTGASLRGGFLGNVPKIRKAIMQSSVDRNRGPNAGFGGAGMAGGMGTKGMPSGGSAPSFAEIMQSRGGFPLFGGPKGMPSSPQSAAPSPEMTGVNMAQLGNMRFPIPTFAPGQPTAPDMDQNFLQRLVAAGIYPDLETAMRGEAERTQATKQGIAQLMPKIAGSFFGGQ